MSNQSDGEQLAEQVEALRLELTRVRDQACRWLLRHPWLIWLVCVYVAACVVVSVIETWGTR